MPEISAPVLSLFCVARLRVCLYIARKPPREHWCKLNTDGSFKATSSSATCGGVLRDSPGVWLCGFVANLGNGLMAVMFWLIFVAYSMVSGLLLAVVVRSLL